MAAPRSCLSEAEVVRYLGGELDDDALAAADVHLDGCAACRALIAHLARASSVSSHDRGRPAGANEATVPGGDDTSLPGATPGDGGDGGDGELIDGQYRLGPLLGRGGMGAVYLARDQRLDRDVAIKLAAAVSPAGLRRVQREAIALARLNHPNVVVVHQVGVHTGRVFIAMEHVPGGNAREWLAAAPRPWREILALYAAAGDGLAAAHAAGLVHRDFKPDNVLVGADGRPRVADFGLVRGDASSSSGGDGDAAPAIRSPPPAPMAPMTQTGAIVGTPAYMAPEQLAGADVDARADQFAFCVAVWEALFGARPFAGRTPAELAEAISQAPPPRPAADRARRVPRHVVRALERGLAHDRAARWPAMAPLLAALRVDPAARRRRLALLVGGATAALGAAASVAIAIATRAAAPAPAPAAAAPACAPLPADAADVYVRAGADAHGTGTAACPLATVTAALARPHPRAVTIHVAAGTYDAAHGERFPLEVRGAVALEGAGADTTAIVGSGRWSPRGSALGDNPLPVTVLAGDPHATIRIGGLALRSGAASVTDGGYGVICDRGALGALATATVVPPNLVLHDVDLGPAYEVAAVATVTFAATGCAMRVEHARVHGDHIGMWVMGCGLVPEDTPHVAAGLEVADTLVEAMPGVPTRESYAVDAWDCTRWLTVAGSTLRDTDWGVVVINHDHPTTHVEITGTSFDHLRRGGLSVGWAARVDRLVDDQFAEVSGGVAHAPGDRAAAILLDSGHNPAVAPQIGYARHNELLDNDIGLEVRGPARVTGPIDLGRADDPGGNEVRCNATLEGSAVRGHDVLIESPVAPGAIRMAGDIWDHAPPSRGGDASAADVAHGEGAPAAVPVDTAAARAAIKLCSMRSP